MSFRLALTLAVLFAAPAQADPYASGWAQAAQSRARLIADGAGGAAVEIELSPGAITYWREPGDAGVAPSFGFGASDNVARVEPLYPAPQRIAEADGGEAFGYRVSVIFPLDVTLAESSRPARLRLNLDYAVCAALCLPARADLELTLPRGVSTPYAQRIAAARARVPLAVAPAELGAALTALNGRAWRLCFAGASAAGRDLFVEPPRPFWLIATPAEGGCFRLDMRAVPADGRLPIPVRATLTQGDKAFETTLTLKAP